MGTFFKEYPVSFIMTNAVRAKGINEDVVRATLLRKMVDEDNQLTIKSKIDLKKLPPAEGNLKPHIYHVNHRVATYKRASE